MTNPTLERAARAVCELHGGDYWKHATPWERGRYRDVARAVLMAVLPDADKSGEAAYRFIQAILNDGEGE